MKKKLLLLLAITTGFIAQSQSTTNFDLIIDQDFDGHKTDIIYEEADAKKDFDKVFPRTAGEIRGLGGKTPQVTRIVGGKIRAHLRKNKVGGKEGGFLFDAMFAKKDEAYLEYDFKFQKDFIWALGGKLPGLGGSARASTAKGAIPSGCVDIKSENQKKGFSCRLMWRTKRDVAESQKKPFLVVYTYLPNRKKKCGEDIRILNDLESNKTYKVKQYIKLNTVGRSNGVLRMWINDKMVHESTNVVFRNDKNARIESLIMQTYRGGGATDLDWAASKDNYIFFDNFKVWTRKTGTGGTTTPTANKAPIADFINPKQDITLTEGYKTLEATIEASDSDGSVEKVNLYINNVLLRSETVAPYTFGKNNNELLNLNIGINNLRAEIIDNDGAITKKYRKITVEKAVVIANIAPIGNFIDPSKDITLTEGYKTLEATVEASDSDGSVEKVNLYINNVLLRSEAVAPYTFGKNNDELLNLNIGINTLRAEIIDNDGAVTKKYRKITIEKAAPIAQVNFSSNNTDINNELVLEEGYESLQIHIDVNDFNKEIAEVKLYLNNDLIRSEKTAPYDWGHDANATIEKELLNIPVGKHTMKAVVVDNTGGEIENSFSLTINSSSTLSVFDNKLTNKKVKIFPNPVVNTDLTISGLENTKQVIEVYNLSGQKIKTVTTNTSNYKLKVNALPSGVYILKIDNLKSLMFIKE